uniref:Superoxide dismutase [Cu-Zn] n=1 Tax=Oryza sativa subsp. indica TaxID=39946 RepID=A0A2H4C477_ORYSI|nr:Cu/Zn superoxide dismutase [Oryza sativa Indica Group]AIW09154.1 Cu/Zn superoxide dismutase [Oryza sativa Indica Group]
MAGKAGGLKGVALIGGAGGNSAVAGALHFFQDPSTGYTEVRGRVTGLAPGLHGFHIHSFGDTTNGCNSTGPHFNPHNKSHGAPSDDERHVGDLGNIVANKDGVADIFIKDLQISLSGPHSILGRAVVVHADSDDLGRGGHELSKTTGNAGTRIGCGIIGLRSAV